MSLAPISVSGGACPNALCAPQNAKAEKVAARMAKKPIKHPTGVGVFGTLAYIILSTLSLRFGRIFAAISSGGWLGLFVLPIIMREFLSRRSPESRSNKAVNVMKRSKHYCRNAAASLVFCITRHIVLRAAYHH